MRLRADGHLSSRGQDKGWETSFHRTFRRSAAQATTATSDLPLLETQPSSSSRLGREPAGARMLGVASSSPRVPGAGAGSPLLRREGLEGKGEGDKYGPKPGLELMGA